MKYGYFNDERKEYVITRPDTPLPWINYLGCEDFFSLISNTGGGYSFYKDAKLLRLTRYRYNNAPLDNNGKYYYIKDGSNIWNPGFRPSKTPLDSYVCRHGLGYSVFHSSKNELYAELTAFVPLGYPCEVNKLSLTNQSEKEKNVSLFSYVEFCLWNAVDDMTNFQRNLSIGEVEVHDSSIYHKTEYRERRNHYAVFSVNTPIDAFDTDRDTFLGAYNGNELPAAVEQGMCSNSLASGWAPIASQQINLTLQPGETRTYIFTLAYIENDPENKWEAPGRINRTPAQQLLSHFQTEEQVSEALCALKAHWDGLLSRCHIDSSEEKLNRMVNIWHQYQCMVTFNMSRSASYYESGTGRGMGFRDSCQDLLGFVHLIPERARERIIDIASTQFEDGSAYHQYQPLTKKGNMDIGSGFNDDPLWLIAAASAYIKETGDFSILSVLTPFDNDESKAAPLLEHLERSYRYTLTHLGPHGLPLIGRADWNDCLNLNCFSETPGESFQTCANFESGKAESIFIAGMFVKYAREYAAILSHLGKCPEAAEVLASADNMEQTILSHGWDGEWFLRAYDAFSEKIGSKECEDGKIYIEPQGFCVMAGVGVKEGLALKALDSVQKYLETDYGVMILHPAYKEYHLNLGEVSSYPPGYKENGGIFCHNNPWVSIAETVISRGNRAFELYRKICPAYLEEISEIHRTEPYVYSQMIAGSDAANHGESKNSWLTGTAAWTFVNVSQYILGIRPELDGLTVDPCLPDFIPGFTATRHFRDADYHIKVTRGSTSYSMTVNGSPVEGKLIPFEAGCLNYDIEVRIK